MVQSFVGDLVLFMPPLDPWLWPWVRDLSPGKKQGSRTCLVWPFWLSGCSACAGVPHSAAAQNSECLIWATRFVGLDVEVWWYLRSPWLSLFRLVSLCPSSLGGRLCPVSFPCFLSGSSCSFQSTCLFPVQFPPFPNSCSDVFSSPASASGLGLACPTTPCGFVMSWCVFCSVCSGPQITGYFFSFIFCTSKCKSANGSWQCIKHQQIHNTEKLLCEIPFYFKCTNLLHS